MRLYNTLTGSIEDFVPRDEGHVGLYVCGPTVQGPPHFGHARASIVPDVLRRYLEWRGYEVFHVRNVTDIDDKIIARAEQEGRTAAEIAERFTRIWEAQISALGTLPPHVVPRATGHVLEMIGLIEQLIGRGAAYVSGGDVFFSVAAFPGYGKLSGRRLDELRAGARAQAGEEKRDPADFALWKAAKPGEPSWPSPWGPGRPGWHIECSAMSTKYLGADFDIHAGGVDLVFPHHENEIAQFEAATGEPFARYWVHNGHLTLEEGKMSKSVGNIIDLEEAIASYGADTLRMFFLRADYRSPVEFSEDRLKEASAGLERIESFVRTTGDAVPAEDRSEAQAYVAAFADAMDDDLSTPKAHAVLFDLVSVGNQHLEADRAAEAAAVREAVLEITGVLGYRLGTDTDEGASLVGPLVEELLGLRQDARARKDFATADRIRDRLTQIGVVVEDTAAGARWHVARGR
jgi:cysteinyl-tRNA synthetase